MLFKKKKEVRRARQPVLPGGSTSQPVFSYHARSARTEATGARKASKLLWLSPSKPSPRPAQRSWFRRVMVVSVVVLSVAFVLNNLLLSRNPGIVATEGVAGQRVLLRDLNVYARAAEAILSSSFTSSNKLTIDTKKVAKTMQQQFPELGSVSVALPIIGRQPVFHIQPVTPALLLKTAAGDMFILDSSGRAVMSPSEAPKIGSLNLAVAEDQSGLKVSLGDIALPSHDIEFIQEVVGQLKAKNLVVTSMVLPRDTSGLDIRIEGAPYVVKFNLRGDARAEVGAFLAVKQHLEREKKTPGSYVDVRVDNRAYYR